MAARTVSHVEVARNPGEYTGTHEAAFRGQDLWHHHVAHDDHSKAVVLRLSPHQHLAGGSCHPPTSLGRTNPVKQSSTALPRRRNGQAIKNEWILGLLPIPTTSEYVLFSDARNVRTGGVFCEASGNVIDIWPRQFPSRFSQAHIFLKELAAIVWFVFAYVESSNLRNVRIIEPTTLRPFLRCKANTAPMQ